MTSAISNTQPNPSAEMPVYFLSHGCPNLLDKSQYPFSEPIGKGLRQIGNEIRGLNPRGMVVISAHWEAGRSTVQINGKSAIPQPLIYDFYGFPDWFYREQFRHRVDPALAQQVVRAVSQYNIEIEPVDRGLDHGVWVSLKKAGLDNAQFPIVQLSLFANESMEDHVRLGKSLASLRHQGIVIVGSGMAVHNLRDMRGPEGNIVRAYVEPFDKEIERAVMTEQQEEDRIVATVLELGQSKLLRKAHPTLEHLLPLHVAVGAATTAGTSKIKGEKLLEAYQISMSWSCYKFSNVAA